MVEKLTTDFANCEVTRLNSVRKADNFTITSLSQACDEIKSDVHKDDIEKVRHLKRLPDSNLSNSPYKVAKENLPAHIFGGVFEGGTKSENLKKHAGLAVIDIDHVTNPAEIVAKLAAIASVVAAWISPSGDGAKGIVAIKRCSTAQEYTQEYQRLIRYFELEHELSLDGACKDISRKCFISHDPEIYTNYNATELDLSPTAYTPVTRQQSNERKSTGSESLERMKSALNSLPIKLLSDRESWLKIGASIHHETNGSPEGFELFDEASKRAGDAYGDTAKIWDSFKREDRGSNVITIGTLLKMALDNGWKEEIAPLTLSDFEASMMELVLTDAEAEAIAHPSFIIDNIVTRGHLVVIPAPPNGGKTTIFFHLAAEMVTKGSKVFYINADISGGDAKSMHYEAKKKGVTLVLPDLKGSSMRGVVKKLEALGESNDDLREYVFIFDTLKKMTDVIEKKQAKNLYSMLRKLTGKGATIILLSHTNKYNDKDGMPIYEGTGDLRSDVDELIYLIPIKHSDGSMTVSTLPDKVRGTFQKITFNISANREVSVAQAYVDTLQKALQNRLEEMNADKTSTIIQAIKAGHSSVKKITAFCIDEGMTRREVPTILKIYEGKFWNSKSGGNGTARNYTLINE